MRSEYDSCSKQTKVTCNKIIIVQNILNPANVGGIDFPSGLGMLKNGISEYLLNQIPWPWKQEQDKESQLYVNCITVQGHGVSHCTLQFILSF